MQLEIGVTLQKITTWLAGPTTDSKSRLDFAKIAKLTSGFAAAHTCCIRVHPLRCRKKIGRPSSLYEE
jgi:hypothetical protein